MKPTTPYADEVEIFLRVPLPTTGRPPKAVASWRSRLLSWLSLPEVQHALDTEVSGDALAKTTYRALTTAATKGVIPPTSVERDIVRTLYQFLAWRGSIEFDSIRKYLQQYHMRTASSVSATERTIPSEHIGAIFAALHGVGLDSRENTRAWFTASMLFVTAIRRSQLLELTLDDVAIEEEVATFRITNKKKSAGAAQVRPITVPLRTPLPNGTPFLVPLMAWMACRPQDTPLLFAPLPEKGEPPGSSRLAVIRGVMRLISNIYEKASGHRLELTPHRFRFTAASIIAHEVGIHQASLILGHDDVATTEKYVLRNYVDATADTIYDAFARFNERT